VAVEVKSTPATQWRSFLPYLLWGAVLAYLLTFLDRGWLPPEEGTLAQAAERVLRGELPHRDFDGMYSGGLEIFHALVFKLVGTRLLSLRIAVFAVFLPTIPLMYRMGRTLAGSVATTIGVLLAIAWGLPNYTSAMPSWYNLFFAFYATAALFEFMEKGQRRWLFAAGLAVGLSIAVKSVGLYLLAAVFLTLIVHEQRLALSDDDGAGGGAGPAGSGRGFSWFILGGLGLFALFALWVFAGPSGPSGYYQFVLPPLALAAYAAAWELDGRSRGPSGPRARRFFGWMLPLGLGVALPMLALLSPYLLSGDLADLWTGWIARPLHRLDVLVRDPPSLATLWTLIPLGIAVLVGAWHSRGRGRTVAVAILSGGFGVLLWFGSVQPVFRAVWSAMLGVGPLVTLVGLLSLWLARNAEVSIAQSLRAERVFAVVAVAGLVSLVQFPTSAPFYFFYAAPMIAMSGFATVCTWPVQRRLGAGAVAIFFILFAGRWIHTGYVYQMADRYAAHPELLPLGLDRAGLRVAESEAQEFHELIQKVRERANGEYIYATPDSPVVYFLAGKRNPTRTFYDLMDPPEGRVARIVEALDQHNINVVVINAGPLPISDPPSSTLTSELVARYPYQEQVGRFIIMWRESE
jgi:Dolichyl-phosphate-mannose-protein mannosyltransferase